MGVTVHFEGQLKGEKEYKSLISFAEQFAIQNQLSVTTIEEHEVRLLRVKNEADWDYIGPVRGRKLILHANSDPLKLEFDKDLYIQEYVKTQFAPITVHLQLIEFLRSISKFFKSLTVDDEAEYWETNDSGKLRTHFQNCFQIIEETKAKNPALSGPVRNEDGRIIDLTS